MRRAALVLGLAAAAAACSDLGVRTAVDRIPVAIATPSFSADIAPLLDETCASSGACHGGAHPAAALDLSLGRAFASLVNAPSVVSPSLRRVRPGFPDSSFAFRALSDDPAYRLGYYRMPLTRTPLPAPVIETIRNWIVQGAQAN